MQKVNIIGAGLAGSEAAYYLARHGISVRLFEMRPHKMTPAHQTGQFAELVCSNSFKSQNIDNACGLLKKEMALLGSLMMKVSTTTSVPSGQALSVDRDLFSAEITNMIRREPLIEVIEEEVIDIEDGITIIATGPLTSEGLTTKLKEMIGEDFLNFFDASAPIIEKDSINLEIAYYKSRYEQGDNSYLNCPFTKEEYERFYIELIGAKIAPLKDFEKNYFSACMPIEVMAKKGIETMRHGPLKPRGLRKTKDHKPYAVLQLRQDNVSASLYNMVGFQTNLTYSEQKRVFRLIPGLENAEFVRYGLMHRNTYINAPKVLNDDFSLRNYPNIYIAGQLSGVEGYVESAMSGLVTAIQVRRKILGKNPLKLPQHTMMGALIHYIVNADPLVFSPMNANYGIFTGSKKHDRFAFAEQSLLCLSELKEALDL